MTSIYRTAAPLGLAFLFACGGRTGLDAVLDSADTVEGGGDPTAFVGAWTCDDSATFTATTPDDVVTISSTDLLTFTANENGTLTLKTYTLMIGSDPEPDDAGQGCTSYVFSVSGSVATLLPGSACVLATSSDFFTNGSFVVSGNTARVYVYSRVSASAGASGRLALTGTCTRN